MLLTLCIIILILYFIQWMKWHQTVPPKLEGYQYIPDCTIIIPFRNESEQIPALLKKLQAHLPDRWRIILVNDHSEDDSLDKIKPHLNLQTQVLQSKGEGKKIALRTGIEMAHTPWIITMDADVQLSNDWTSSLYCADWSSDMIIFSLHMPGSHDFIFKTQALEFSIFQYLTAKSCYKGQPQLCNGALLGFKRKAFIEVGGYERHEEIASGGSTQSQAAYDTLKAYLMLYTPEHLDKAGLQAWVGLYGIESPGLTSCLAIAEVVRNRLR